MFSNVPTKALLHKDCLCNDMETPPLDMWNSVPWSEEVRTCTVNDTIQGVTSYTMNKWYWAPNFYIVLSVVILVVVLICEYRLHTTWCLVITVIVIYLVIAGIRQFVMMYVDPCIMPDLVPDRDARRFIISGHLLTVGLIAYIIWRVSKSILLKVIMLIAVLSVGPVLVITREHYTSDIMVTWILLLIIYIILTVMFP